MLKVNSWVYATIAICALGAIVITAIFAGGSLPIVLGGIGTVLMAVLSAAKGDASEPPKPPPLPLLLTLALLAPVIAGPMLACGASGPAPGSPLAVQAAGCIAHRTARQLECVDLYPTKAEIDACRAKVKADLDCTAKDGGDQ